ncbi:MAG: Mrp/NBP35 family ATP-binding protein [Polyangiaceae bacterium]|nr:Mrp/NBP35 family ATP-binding protein [Polyangiaceae bacterium]
MAITREQVLEALTGVQDPNSNKSVIQLDMLKEVDVADDGKVMLSIEALAQAEAVRDALQKNVVRAVQARGANAVEVRWSTRVLSRDIGADDPVPGVSNVIVVMSGKGGVGKSTVAANMALALKRIGARVGLLDADIYGPSVPTMMGTMARPTSVDGQSLEPVERFGLKLMSIGFLLEDPREAVVWRGPMLHGALMQFLKDVHWGKLDYLFLDLPPGTGDIPLTLSQKLHLTGAVIVTTPQDVALQDVYKSVSMCQKVNIPVLGVVENQSYFVCDGCDKRHEIFGTGGGQKVAEMAHAPLLAQIPMDTACREAGDAGTPVVASNPESPAARALRDAAEALAIRIAAHHAERGGTVVSIDRSGGVNRHLPIVR